MPGIVGNHKCTPFLVSFFGIILLFLFLVLFLSFFVFLLVSVRFDFYVLLLFVVLVFWRERT